MEITNHQKKKVQEMAFNGDSTRDIAEFLKCDESSLRGPDAHTPTNAKWDQIRKIIKKARAQRRSHVRKIQFQILNQLNPTMAIYLGKVVCKQKEPTQKVSHTTETVFEKLGINGTESE